MSKKTWYLLGILLTILIGTYFYWKLCCGDVACCGNENNKEKVVNDTTQLDSNSKTATVKATLTPFSVSDPKGDFSFSSQDNFNFDTSGFSILRPVSSSINGGIDELQLYLTGNENKGLAITGLYTSKEENPSAFPNLGMARANAVKNYLITKGIPSSRVNLFGKLDDGIIPEGSIYKGPVIFEMTTADATSAEKDKAALMSLKERIQADPLVLHFETAQTAINLTEAQRQKIAAIVQYLDKTTGGKALVTGHTDTTGSREGNITISKKRADFARDYLVSNGIPTAKIETSGKGPDVPIASNATEEGRAQNRRTVVTVN